MIGTFLASIGMPLLLTDNTEFFWAIGLSALCALCMLPKNVFQNSTDNGYTHLYYRLCTAAFLWVILFGTGFSTVSVSNRELVHSSRNFYGTAKVYDYDDRTSLSHGNTLHGVEPKDPNVAKIPPSYYTTMSGVGRALRIAKSHGAINVGVIGLGSGSLAVYCSPGDSFVFYEIDKRMVFIAEKYFTYVPKCSGTNILLGDARLTIQNELKGAFKPYDLLAVDAFSDDSIPMHLLTKEAIELYLNRIKEDGIVAIHVSNRYLGLAPVVHKIAHTLRIPSLEVTTAQQGEFGSASTWVLLTRNAEYFADPRFADVKLGASSVQGPLWTDDFNALSSVVTIPLPSFLQYFKR
jgi:hypothetical protein